MIRWPHRKSKKLKVESIISLIIFVGVPLPTTGLWSAVILASRIKMRIKDALLVIFIENTIAEANILTLFMHVEDGQV